MPQTTNQGKVSIVPKGAYSAETPYNRLDLVTDSGNTYLALADSTGAALTDTTKWWKLIDTEGIWEAIDSAAHAITETATGSIVTIPDGADNVPVKSLIAQINPVQAGSGDPSPENIRAITGWTGCTISHSGEDTSNPEEYTIAFPADAGTVYGGTLDVTNGVLTVTWKGKIFNGTETLAYNSKDSNYISVTTSAQATDRIATHVICSHLKTLGRGNTENIIRNRTSASGFSMFFGRTAICDLDTSAFIALTNAEKVALVNAYMTAQYEAGTPVTVVYQLMEPITYQVTPAEVTTILGINNIWADTGNVTVQYRADTKTYVDSAKATLKDFGAVGDGVTDDTAAIQRALTLCAGETLHVTAGTYLFSQTLNIFSGTRVIGCGTASKFKLADTFSLTPYPWRTGDPLVADQYRYPMVYMDTDTDGIILENFALEGQTNAFYDKNCDGITLRGKNHIVRNLIVTKINFFPDDFAGRVNNGVGHGIKVQDGTCITIDNCDVEECGYECIGIENAQTVTVSNCVCKYALQTAAQIHRNCENIRMAGNSFDNTDRNHTGSSGNGPGLTLHASTDYPMNDVVIDGNYIKSALVFANGGGENNIKIINNRIVGGISLNAIDGWRNRCTVIGNTLGSQLNLKSDNAIITGNMIYHTGGGYMISSSGNNVVCYGNIPLNATTKGVRIVNHEGTSATASTMQEYAVGPDGSIDTSGTFAYNGTGIVYNG